ncbi:restriction endonuclease subunit S [Dubosiella newyorkensis]|uniref:restriction endonuclease subunit S n=2 Tax=Dubosiella newyorkensis TaxID=1862672 RepID=UPI00272E89DC|nr:restriction endonuclease subunit S [Dubosiella newyorkensis]
MSEKEQKKDKKANVPKLRFPGFTEPWEQRRLGEAFINLQNNTLSRAELSSGEGKVKNVHYGDLLVIFSEVLNVKKEELPTIKDESIISKYKESFLKNGDIVMADTAEDETVGKCTEIEGLTEEIVISGLHTIPYRPQSKFAPRYLGYYLNSAYYHDQLLPLTQGIKVSSISKTSLKSTYISYPKSLVEQGKIGNFFNYLDHLITLHQRKLDDLKKLKKGLLQKMFPKNGEKVPELRFPGFKNDWEQRKLSEVATMHARIGWQNLRTSEFLDSGDYMLITGTDFNDGAINYSTCHFVERERYEQDKHIQIKNGSILITKDGTLGKVAYVQGLSIPATLNAGVFNVEIKDETEIDNKYLFQYLKAPFLMDYVDKKATGGTIKHLNQNILVDFPVLMPSKTEQEAIGVYFERLDNLITLHQRKLDHLKELKKGLLQQMFV